MGTAIGGKESIQAWQTRSLSLPITGGFDFDENGKNDECTVCPQNKGFAPQAPDNDEVTKMAKSLLASCTNAVCQKPCLSEPYKTTSAVLKGRHVTKY